MRILHPFLREAIQQRSDRIQMGIANRLQPIEVRKSQVDLERWFYGGYAHPKDLGQEITRPMDQDAWFFACQDVLCRVMTQIPFVIRRISDKTPIDRSHAIQKLFIKPNPLMSRSQLWEATLIYRNIDGSSFYIYDWGQGLNNPLPGPPKAIWPFSGNYFRAIKSRGNIAGWEFAVPQTMINKALLPEEMARFWKFSAYRPLHDKGQSIVTPAARAMSVNYAAQSYELNYIRNYGVPVGALKSKKDHSKPWIDTQRAMWKKYYGSGPRTAGDIAVLVGGLEFEQYSASIRDIRPDTLHEASREAVCAVSGIPPGIVGIMRYANYANLDVQKILMLRFTVRPNLIQIQEVLEADFFPRFAPDLYGEFDMSVFPELQLSQAEKILMAKDLLPLGITWRMIETILEIGIDVDALGLLADTSFLTMNLLPAGETELAAKKLKGMGLEALLTGNQKMPISIMQNSMPKSNLPQDKTPETERAIALANLIHEAMPDLKNLPSPDAEDPKWNHRPEDKPILQPKGKRWQIKIPAATRRRINLFLRRLRPLELEVARLTKKWFYENRSIMLDNLMAQAPAFDFDQDPDRKIEAEIRREAKILAEGEDLKAIKADVDPSILASIEALFPNINEQSAALAELIVPLSEQALVIGGNEVIAELAALGIDVGAFVSSHAAAVAYLASKNLAIKDLVSRYYDAVRDTLIEGYLEGEGVGEISLRLKYTNNIASGRAQMIARTEMVGAATEGRWQSMGEQGIGYKGWGHGTPKDARPSHVRADGEIVPFEENFLLPSHCVNPGTMSRPYDWLAGDCCENCSCTCSLFTPTKFEDGSDIPLEDLYHGGKASIWTEKFMADYKQNLPIACGRWVNCFARVFTERPFMRGV